MAKTSNLLLLDEPTNDLDIETLDLLQEILSEYDGTIILISHDRDFVDRVATRILLLEENSKIIDFTGGYESYLNNSSKVDKRLDTGAKSARSKNGPGIPIKKKSMSLSFTEQHRLIEISREVEKLESEVKKLEEFLSTEDLFQLDRVKFDKASSALLGRKLKMDELLEEWLYLEDKKS
jgi:ATP-binding cassette subfamily F protein uup